MREIKYKAWHRKNKRWIEDFYIRDGKVYVLKEGAACGDEECCGSSQEDLIEIFWASLIEYTGLKDKHGKEIYEGDLLKITTIFHTYSMPVIWDDDCWTLKDDGTYGTLSEWNKASEIIGNKFENPELLEK